MVAGPVTTAAAPRSTRREVTASTRRMVRLLVTSAWSLLWLFIMAAIAVLLFVHRGDAEGSARLANAEIEAQLQRGERVEHRVAVMQRHWWDFYRVTHGVLAATDRRLLFVGVPPAALLPRGFEPQEFLVRSIPYDRPVTVRLGPADFGTRPALRLAVGDGRERFAFLPLDRARMDSVVAVLERRQAALRAAAEAERRATEAAIAASRRAIHHLVQRGESLDLIARRYGISVDSIIKWNGLTSTRITAGRRLLVKPEAR
ncbi:MAG: hypothetical protein ABS52_13665 [Gemmatimonadetes bacterium SCN 70-22]|nr:MAG: hypothetical protein ABS52_13665 [Gemmatimonadetes bacterium SCN 70-22]